MTLRQYRFPVKGVVRMGEIRDERGRPVLAIESVVPPVRVGVVLQVEPKRRPSYRQRHKRRRR